MRIGRGVRKVNEAITEPGRTVILTEEDKNKYNWDKIPDGTLHINPNDGTMSVKLKGASDWVPAGLKNDGTISIAKDTIMHEETFTIVEINLDKNKHIDNIVYELKNKDRRHTDYDKRYGFVFNLEEGRYPLGRACIEVMVDDLLRRTEQSGGLKELSETSFALDDDLEVGSEITARYYSVVRIGNPYPRVFESTDEPAEAEAGDLWIDYTADPEDIKVEGFLQSREKKVSWNDIVDKPTTLGGYGIKEDKYALADHKHTVKDIIGTIGGLNGTNGGNAETVNYYKADQNKPNTLCILDAQGKIPGNMLQRHNHLWSDITDHPTTMTANGGNADTVAHWTVDGNKPNTIATLDANGNIPANHIGSHLHMWADISDRPAALPANGGNSDSVDGYKVQNNTANSIALLNGAGQLDAAHIGHHTHSFNDINDIQKGLDALLLPGMIMLWYGNAQNVPKGWVICNGKNGTPDMTGRVPVGAGNGYNMGSYGGEAQHVLKKEELPSLGKGHLSAMTRHGAYPDGDGVMVKTETKMSVGIAQASGTDQDGRNFTVDLETGFNNKPINEYPPYCALYYIMKI